MYKTWVEWTVKDEITKGDEESFDDLEAVCEWVADMTAILRDKGAKGWAVLSKEGQCKPLVYSSSDEEEVGF